MEQPKDIKNPDFIGHAVLDVLLQHNLYVLRQSMLFMSDKAMDTLVDTIAEFRTQIQSVRIKSKGTDK